MKPLFVIGSSGHASTVLEAIELQGEYRVLGLLDSFEQKGKEKHGYPVIGAAEEAAELAKAYACTSFFIAIGDNWKRWGMASKLMESLPSIEFATAVHPSVLISKTARVAHGCFLMAGVIVCANARIGRGCIVNTASTVNHDCMLADYASLSAGVHLGGACAIGIRSSVGLGSTVREKRLIGRDTVIGAGAVVLDDMPDEVVVYGVPAKVIRSRAKDESYML